MLLIIICFKSQLGFGFGRRISLDIPYSTRQFNNGNQYSTNVSHSHTQTSKSPHQIPIGECGAALENESCVALFPAHPALPA